MAAPDYRRSIAVCALALLPLAVAIGAPQASPRSQTTQNPLSREKRDHSPAVGNGDATRQVRTQDRQQQSRAGTGTGVRPKLLVDRQTVSTKRTNTPPSPVSASPKRGVLQASRSGQNLSSDAMMHFEAKVRPALLRHCTACHGASNANGGIRLDRAPDNDTAMRIARALSPAAPKPMPPTGPLDQATRQTISAWAAAGAPWPDRSPSVPSPRSHWAFQPVRKVTLPAAVQSGAIHPVDFLVNRRLRQLGHAPGPLADKHTLLRRLSFDLTGLPPTRAELDTFLTDKRPDAWERHVDRLLASPRYGEKWGRHWMDVVHYADTAGENSDHPLPHAWRYRNWIIDAFNKNIPYNRFIEWQIAGDHAARRLGGQDAKDAVVATGFLAGARRFGHDIDADIHLTHEDAIATLGAATLGLTVGCARCHDHKFDPIPQTDYTALAGIFQSTKLSYPGCEPFQQPRDLIPLADAKTRQRDAETVRIATQRRDDARGELGRIAAPLRPVWTQATLLASGVAPDGAPGTPIASGTSRIAATTEAGDIVLLLIHPNQNHGADTTSLSLTIAANDGLGGTYSTSDWIDRLPATNPLPDPGANTPRWLLLDMETGPEPFPHKLDSIDQQSALRGWRSGETPSVFANRASQPVDVWTRLPARTVFAHPGPRGPVGIAWIAPRAGTWTLEGAIADVHRGGDGVSWEVRILRRAQAQVDSVIAGSAQLRARTQELADAQTAADHGVAFGAVDGKPVDSRLQRKGDPNDLGDIVPRGFLTILGGQRVRSTDTSGRPELAAWITDPKNPLTARVWVNRIWQGHFGRGIVTTPNDFGTRGAPPENPELLDWLASELVRRNWDTKAMHRLILTSAAYRRAPGAAVLAQHLARFPLRRLSAEELRDSLLQIGGLLDTTPAGPHPFPPESSWSFTQHSPFQAEYDTDKRSVYVLQKRNRRTPFFALFDGADPNASVAVRDQTTVPTQSLWLLNNQLVHRVAKAVATNVDSKAPDPKSWIRAVFQRVNARDPVPQETRAVVAFLERMAKTGQATAAEARESVIRMLLASNEVLHVR